MLRTWSLLVSEALSPHRRFSVEVVKFVNLKIDILIGNVRLNLFCLSRFLLGGGIYFRLDKVDNLGRGLGDGGKTLPESTIIPDTPTFKDPCEKALKETPLHAEGPLTGCSWGGGAGHRLFR
jgi:hypothetical protein